MPRRLSAEALIARLSTSQTPTIIDVRREEKFHASGQRIAGAFWRDHRKVAEWYPALKGRGPVVVYCAHGHNVSEIAAASLTAVGADVAILDGGLDTWEAAGGATVRLGLPGIEDTLAEPSVWVTRQRPKIDRIACPWLIRRFIDPRAIFHFVAPEWVRDVADEMGWIPFDIDGVHYSHRGETCSFDTLIEEAGLADPALLHLARIVRGADTARPDLEPEAAGLLAVSLGLSAIEPDDHAQLEKGMAIYDALYGWCRNARDERHNWPAAKSAA